MLRKLTEFAECTGTAKAYRDTYLRTPKSGYTGLPVISRTPNINTLNICMKEFGSEKIIFDKMTAVKT